MKILVINGSPKGNRSNTYKLTKAFLAGMEESVKAGESTFEVEEIFVNRQEIRPCLGCFSCWSKTPGICCIQDDMQDVIRKLLWADVTIWSFPLYYFTVPGGLKNLIDRQLPMVQPFMTENEAQTGNGSHPLRYDMSNKKTVVISTCGFYTAQGNYDGVCSLFDHVCGKGKYTAVFCGQGELFRVPDLSRRTDEYLGYVKEAGREYVAGGILPKTREKLDQLLYPREIFEKWADMSWGIKRPDEEKESDALNFTKNMAVLYRKESYSGREQVLEMYYTDVQECYQIIMGKDGSRVVKEDFMAATTRIETPLSLWRSIAAGEIRGDEALMNQLYKVKGDFNLLLKWDEYFTGLGDNAENTGQKAKGNSGSEASEKAAGGIHVPKRGTNMQILLIPWMTFWIAVGINRTVGSFVSIGVCALAPLLFYCNKKTLYDILSAAFVSGLSMAVLLGASDRAVLPLSYLIFGVMWTLTCFGKIPLTAHYSMNGYHGEDALKNPLFMKTNWILTLMWGILYLVTPIWTYFIMGTQMRTYIGAVNSILPIFMGIFTVWFEKWYPAKIAAGR